VVDHKIRTPDPLENPIRIGKHRADADHGETTKEFGSRNYNEFDKRPGQVHVIGPRGKAFAEGTTISAVDSQLHAWRVRRDARWPRPSEKASMCWRRKPDPKEKSQEHARRLCRKLPDGRNTARNHPRHHRRAAPPVERYVLNRPATPSARHVEVEGRMTGFGATVDRRRRRGRLACADERLLNF